MTFGIHPLVVQFKLESKIMANTVTNPGHRLAGLSADLFHKLQSGVLSEDQLVLFLKGKNPFEKKTKKGQEMFAVSENFVNSPGLWVDPDFTSRIVVPCGTVPVRPLSDLKDPIVLPRNMSDSEICQELLGGREQAKANAVCPLQIWQLIELQKGGVAGKMLNNGFANIFYVIGKDNVLFVVRVVWGSDGSLWGVYCYQFDGFGFWSRGGQIFSN